MVNNTESRFPSRVCSTVSASNLVRPSAMAISSPANASWVSGRKIRCDETRSSSLLRAPNSVSVVSFTSTIFTIEMACRTKSG